MKTLLIAAVLVLLASPAFAVPPRCVVTAVGPGKVSGSVTLGNKTCAQVDWQKVSGKGSCVIAITSQGRKYQGITLPKACSVVTVTESDY
jgi:hypothetical protein